MHALSCGAILFDMDGVLVDSTAVVKRVWRRWSEAKGLELGAILEVAQGRRTVDTLHTIAPEMDLPTELRWLEEAELSDREGIVPVPGAQELLGELPVGRWAVVTSASRELAARRLGWAGLPSPICLVTADEVAEGKPSPEGYLRAATELGIPAGDCVVIEDAPAGVRAAVAAGMRVVGLTTTHAEHAMPPTDALVPDLRSIVTEVHQGRLRLEWSG